jgi:hypothetical protein
MVKIAAFLGLALLAAAVAASANPLTQVGVPDGRLAAASLSSGDFEKAARRLNAVRPDAANDPARLINLGNAYVGMGRLLDAKAAYTAARYAAEDMLTLADGTEASSRDIARTALRRINMSYASR